jgi:hypothetical protein
MSDSTRLNWVRIVVAVVAAEALPILALVIVVSVYAFVRKPDSLSPDEFAPIAGDWVGPIGGFLATTLFALRAAKRARRVPMAHGIAVGAGTALLDFSIALQLTGGGPISGLLFVSNGGRILAGVLGGWLGSRAPKRDGEEAGSDTGFDPSSSAP